MCMMIALQECKLSLHISHLNVIHMLRYKWIVSFDIDWIKQMIRDEKNVKYLITFTNETINNNSRKKKIGIIS